MISRATIAFDRLATLVVALVLVLAGVSAIAWWLDAVSWLPGSVDLSSVKDAMGQSWWPWALALVGVLLVLLGLRWIIGHVPDRGVKDLRLPGSNEQGKLRAAATPVATVAAQVLEDTPGVRSSSGKIVRERGQLVAQLRTTIEAGADLRSVAAAADQVSADLARVLERDDVRCLVQLKVAARSRPLPRVD